MSNQVMMAISAIHIGPRKRQTETCKVDAIADSLYHLGFMIHPILVDQCGGLIAGLHRLKAAEKLGWEEVPVEVRELSKYKIELAEIDETLIRSELSTLQRSQWLSRREALLEQIDALHQSGDNQYAGQRPGHAPGAPPRRTKAELAAEVGMSKRSYQESQQIAKGIDPDVQAQLIETDVADSTKQLLQLSKMSSEDQHQVADLIAAGEARDVREAARKLRRETLHAAPLPDGQFNLVVADMPWKYDNDGARGAAENHYPTMTLEEMLALPIGERFTRNCVLFLWVTNHHHEEAMALIKHWGLTYKSEIVWEKPNIGTGSWTRGKHEKLWIAARGEHMTPTWLPDSVQHWPAAEHSRKPVEAYEMIEKMYGHLRGKIELFARAERPGWVCWGNETDKFSAPEGQQVAITVTLPEGLAETGLADALLEHAAEALAS